MSRRVPPTHKRLVCWYCAWKKEERALLKERPLLVLLVALFYFYFFFGRGIIDIITVFRATTPDLKFIIGYFHCSWCGKELEQPDCFYPESLGTFAKGASLR